MNDANNIEKGIPRQLFSDFLKEQAAKRVFTFQMETSIKKRELTKSR